MAPTCAFVIKQGGENLGEHTLCQLSCNRLYLCIDGTLTGVPFVNFYAGAPTLGPTINHSTGAFVMRRRIFVPESEQTEECSV